MKGSQVLDAKDLPDVPFGAGGHVILKPVGGRKGAIVDRRIEPGLEQDVYGRRRPSGVLKLGKRERQKGEQARPPGEALGYGFDQIELAGAGEEEPPRPRIGIDDSLQAGEKTRTPLDFIQDGFGAQLAQEAVGILGGEGAPR